MDPQSRFALIVDAFVSSGAPPKRASVQLPREGGADTSEYQAQRVARVRGRLVTFGDGPDEGDQGGTDAES